MPARTTRQEARERVIRAFMSSLDKVIPAEESVPLKGGTFREWEDQAAQVRQAVVPTLLEERSALEENAEVLTGGHCPFCSSEAVYLKKEQTQSEVTRARRTGDADQAALPVPPVWRHFFPLRTVIGRCRRKRR